MAACAITACLSVILLPFRAASAAAAALEDVARMQESEWVVTVIMVFINLGTLALLVGVWAHLQCSRAGVLVVRRLSDARHRAASFSHAHRRRTASRTAAMTAAAAAGAAARHSCASTGATPLHPIPLAAAEGGVTADGGAMPPESPPPSGGVAPTASTCVLSTPSTPGGGGGSGVVHQWLSREALPPAKPASGGYLFAPLPVTAGGGDGGTGTVDYRNLGA